MRGESLEEGRSERRANSRGPTRYFSSDAFYKIHVTNTLLDLSVRGGPLVGPEVGGVFSLQEGVARMES